MTRPVDSAAGEAALTPPAQRRLLRHVAPELSEPAEETARRLVAVAVAFALAAAGVQTALGLVNGIALDHRYRLLDPDREFTMFSWGSAVATFAAAFVVLVLASVERRERGRLVVLAAVLSFVSLSDLVIIHEPLTRRLFVNVFGLPLGLGARMSSVLLFPLLAAGLVLLLLQARRAPRSAALAIVAGLGCLAAAVGLELLNGALSALGLITFRQPLDVVFATAEEGLELAGWILVAGGLAAAMAARFVERGVRAGTSPSRARPS